MLLFEKKQSRAGPMSAAVVFEIFAVVLLIFMPLFFANEDLRESVLIDKIFFPPGPPPGPHKSDKLQNKSSEPAKPKSNPQEKKPAETPPDIFQSPTEIPKETPTEGGGKNEKESENEKEGGGDPNGVPGGEPCGTPDCVPGGTGEPEPPRVGGQIKQAKLIHKVEPVYPPLAKKNRVQGDVLLEAIIGIDGNTHNIKVISGHPLLRQSAIDAVEQWIYEPATLNGKPIEVATTITVKYILK